jgi:hypothetical protein
MKLPQLSKLIAISTISSATCLLVVGKAEAVQITLDFEGIGNTAQIDNFYNGGAGTNYGVSFDNNARASIDNDVQPGGGEFENEPSPSTVMDFRGTGTIMNVAGGGFDTFSTFYSAGNQNQPGSIELFSGLDGTGTLLASLSNLLTPTSGNGVNDRFTTFSLASLSNFGTAQSVRFGGTANQILFDNVSFNTVSSSTQVPEPFTVIGTLIGGTAAFRMRKKLKSGHDKL